MGRAPARISAGVTYNKPCTACKTSRVVDAFRGGVSDLIDEILRGAVNLDTQSDLLLVGRKIDALQVLPHVSQGARIHACLPASSYTSRARIYPVQGMPQLRYGVFPSGEVRRCVASVSWNPARTGDILMSGKSAVPLRRWERGGRR